MASPPQKRSKVDSDLDDIEAVPPLPVIFKSPDLIPDTRLTIFENTLHCNSVFLRLHSAYFRKFLDSPDKPAASPSAAFKYEYVAVMEEDETWYLEAASKASPAKPLDEEMIAGLTKEQKKREFDNFHKLVCAIYTRPYTIESVSELVAITDLADFYRALPVLSATIMSALATSPILKWDPVTLTSPLAENAHIIIISAAKLRHKALFRECFIHTVGRWKHLKEEDCINELRTYPEIYLRLHEEYYEVCQYVMQANKDLLACIQNGSLHISQLDRESVASDYSGTGDPKFYQKLYQEVYTESKAQEENEALAALYSSLHILAQNTLELDKVPYNTKGGPHSNHFLCAWIHDDHLPFRTDEFDW